MKKTLFLLIGFLSPQLSQGAALDQFAAPADVAKTVQDAAEWQIAHAARHDPKNWVHGPFYAGLLAWAEASGESRFEHAMLALAKANAWKPAVDPYNADDQVVGQAYIELYLRHRQPEMIRPVQESFDFVLRHPKELWYWCDALFMGPPTWARLTAATGNPAYLKYALAFWDKTTRLLYDSDEHLYFRDESFIAKRSANGQKIFWSRGNGWVLAGLARLLQFLPSDHPARAHLEEQFRSMAERVAALQQADGLWRASLLDPDTFPQKEVSGSAFFCYALAWGVNHGLLEGKRFGPVVWRAWAAIASSVQPDGKLTNVQPIGAAPGLFPADASEPYGVGALLLAGSETFRLAGGRAMAGTAAVTPSPRDWTRGVDDRSRWCALAGRIADPVIYALAQRRMKKTMPVEALNPAERAACTHLEAFGRLLAGLAPWLELGDDGTAEGLERGRIARHARTAMDSATDAASPDRMNFTEGAQPLVDAAFLAHAVLRAPNELGNKLEPRVRANLISCLKATRAIRPYPGNWLLFASMVEVTLQQLGEPRDDARLMEGITRFQEWYVGDGHYGDGPEFHWDYYNAYVIQPMLVDVLEAVGNETAELQAFRAKVRERAQRFAAIQERLIAPDGSFPVVGRSIAYRGAAFQGLAQAALHHGLPERVSPGQARAALTSVIRRTLEAPDTFDDAGWLRIGLSGHQPSLAETYISTGSLYLCAAVFLPLGLPPTDPFWTEPRGATTWEKVWSGADIAADKALKSPR